MRKGAKSAVLLTLLFLAGLALLLYPLVSSRYNARRSAALIEDYTAAVADTPQEDYSAWFAAADAYNASLTGKDVPDAFAAIVICCGRAGVRDKPDTFVYDLSKLAGTPVWIFHGLEDATVSADHALAALRALLGINPKGDFRLTLYPGVGHESYEYAFRDPLLYAWLEVSGK